MLSAQPRTHRRANCERRDAAAGTQAPLLARAAAVGRPRASPARACAAVEEDHLVQLRSPQMLHWQRADDDGEQAVVAGLRVNGHHGQPPPRPAATIILLPPPQQEPKQEQQEPNQHLQQLWRAATAVHSSVGQPAPQPPPSALQTDPQASIAAIKAAPSLAALEAACAAVPASSARQPGVVLAAASRLEALVRTHTAHVQDWRDAQRWPQHQEQPQQEHQQQHHHQHERQHRQRQLAGSPPRGGGAHRLASAAKPHIRSVLACLCQWTVEAHSITAGEQQPALAPHPHPDTRPHTKRRRQWHRRHASGAAPPTPAQARRVLWPHQAATILHALARAARVAGPGCVSTAAVQQLAACLTAEDGPVEKGGTPLMPAQVVTAAWSLAVLGPHHLLQPQQRPPQQAPSSSSASEPPSPSPSPGGLLASVLQWLYRGTQPHLGEYSGAQTARLLWALGTLVDASPPGSGGGRAHDWAPGHPSQPRPGGAWWRALEAGMLSCPCAAAPGTQLNGWACGCLPGDVLPRPLSRLEAWTLAELALCCWGAGLLADAPHTTQALDRQGRPGAQQPGEGHPSPLWVEGLERAVWAALRRTRRAQHQQGAQLITGLQRLWACALQPPSRPATAAAAGHEAPHPHQSALLAAIVQATAPGAAVARLSSSSGGGSSTTVHARSGSGGWPAALAAPAPVRVLVPSGGGGAGARPPGTLPQPHLPLPQGHGQPWVDAETAPLLLHVNGGAAPTLSDLEPLLRHQLVAAGGPAGTQLQAAPPTERSALQRPLPPPAPPAGSGAAWAHGRAAASAAAGAQLQARGGALPLTQLVQVVRSCRRLGTPLPPATLHTLSHSLEMALPQCCNSQLVGLALGVAALGLVHPPASLARGWLGEVGARAQGAAAATLKPHHVAGVLKVLVAWQLAPPRALVSGVLQCGLRGLRERRCLTGRERATWREVQQLARAAAALPSPSARRTTAQHEPQGESLRCLLEELEELLAR